MVLTLHNENHCFCALHTIFSLPRFTFTARYMYAYEQIASSLDLAPYVSIGNKWCTPTLFDPCSLEELILFGSFYKVTSY